MKILNARVNWMLGYANRPFLEVLVDKFPDLEEFEFDRRGSLWFAEKEGAVMFFYHSGEDKSEDGFGGAHFKLRMKDGSVKVLKGPWSSRSGVMNKAGFTPSLDVSIFEDEESFKRGYTAFAGHITLDLAKEALKKFLKGVYLLRIQDATDDYYVPSLSSNSILKSNGETCNLFKGERIVEAIGFDSEVQSEVG